MAFQRLAIELGGGGQQRVERGIGWLAGLLAFYALFARHFHACCFGEVFDSLGEIQIVVIHDEAERVAASAATEAVIELFVRADAERGCFLFVERAAGGVVLPGFLELHARTDYIDNVGAVQKVVDKALGNQPGHGVLIIQAWCKSIGRLYERSVSLSAVFFEDVGNQRARLCIRWAVWA
ncbi:hypothetical protein ALP91_200137 [Pseudomonas savastanoi pv. glycinea]|nr:hypothetical protein ALP91_200137 [Pseudomonas savastanoi pv. glycinea]